MSPGYRSGVSGPSYRPSDELYARIREAADADGQSVQAFLDRVVTEDLDRREVDLWVITASIIERNRGLLERLAQL